MATVKQVGIKTSDGNYDYRDIGVKSENIEWSNNPEKPAEDGIGNVIKSSYVAGIDVSGNTATLKSKDNTSLGSFNVGQWFADTEVEAGALGMVKKPTTQEEISGYLRGDGTWAAASVSNDRYTSVDEGRITISDSSTVGATHTIDLATTGVQAGSYGPETNVTGTNNTTISVPYITVDSYGRITAITNKTLTNRDTTYNFSGGIKKAGSDVSLTDHSSSSTTYGIGNTTKFGHVRLSDNYNSNDDAASGTGASSKALYDAVQYLDNKIGTGNVILPIYSSSATDTPTEAGAIWITE